MDVKGLMENKPLHWTDLASCVGDDRFTGTFDVLSGFDQLYMTVTCLNCPVNAECMDWADRNQVTDVWAGYWRFPDGCVEQD